MKSRYSGRLRHLQPAAILALVVLLGACSQAVPKVVAQEPASDTFCVLDGMLLKEHPGPKAQIHYVDGKPEFFCDLLELFTVTLTPEQKRPVAAMFVQDMGKTDWEHPQANWIDAKTALYVVGSRKTGSMGPTFGSFSSMQDAEAFVKQAGGRIVHFEQITPQMLSPGASAVHTIAMAQ